MNTLYQITCQENGKAYIGKTVQRLAIRMARHRYVARRGRGARLGAAIRKYGWDKFRVEILCHPETIEELNAFEIGFIEMYFTTDKRFGYNLTPGGDGISSARMKELWQTPEYRAKMALRPKINSGTFIKGNIVHPTKDGHREDLSLEARQVIREKVSSSLLGNIRHLGIPHSEETRSAISLGLIGNQNNLGNKASDETRAKMRSAHAGKPKPWMTKEAKAIRKQVIP